MTTRLVIFVAVVLCTFAPSIHTASTNYQVGTSLYDITGPAAEANMMGMANIEQISHGIQLRLFSRCFVIADASAANRVAFISADLAFIPGGVTEAVIQQLNTFYKNQSRYSFANVMISATHTHSGPGGYSTETLYDATSFGFIQKNFDTIVDGLANSIILADKNIQPANIFIQNGTLLNSNANRSPYSYTYNPDASNYQYNTDKNFTLLRIEDASGNPMGLITWFAVHGTSMNNTNQLISGDNKGFASYFVERSFNPSSLPGKNSFVAAFGQSNEGDVSPNTLGASCPNGTACDQIHSTCNGRVQGCIAPGPGYDMSESCQIIGMYQAQMALQLFDQAKTPLSGPVAFRHQFINFEQVNVSAQFSSTGQPATTCTAALGDSFAAGTTDGPGFGNFVQGTNTTSANPIWNALGHLLSKPTLAEQQCQFPKPILLNTGNIRFPGNAPWTASVIPVQMFRIGQLYILGVPGEFTTMSGRRLRNQVRSTLVANGAADANSHVVIAGLSNEYIHYVTTPEEFNVQRYEAASTLYGPQQLPAFLQQFTVLAKSIAQNTTLSPGDMPPKYNFTLRLFPDWPQDTHPIGSPFGSVLQNVNASYTPGQVATVEFQGANPRNNYRTGDTFLTVEKLNSNNNWDVVLTDSDWDTIFRWHREGVQRHSRITLYWTIGSQTPAGTYRMRYFGDAKNSDGSLTSITGTSASFKVSSSVENTGAPFGISVIKSIVDWWLRRPADHFDRE